MTKRGIKERRNMKKLIKGSDTGYKVVDSGEGWGYYVFITDEKANECRNYEYSAGCGTIEDVENELQKYSYEEIVKQFMEWACGSEGSERERYTNVLLKLMDGQEVCSDE